jgi:hypothetical protein
MVPACLALFWLVEWLHERAATSGDPQPGLAALLGFVSVAAAVIAIFVGTLIRAANERRPE